MKKVLVIMAPGFEEIETVTVVDILRRAGGRVTVAGIVPGVIEGSRGMSMVPDASLDAINPDGFDLVVLPGGQPGTDNLGKDPRVLEILKNMDKAGKQIAAICAAPKVLHAAGLLQNKRITSHPSIREQFPESRYCEDRVVVDGNIITSRSPGTAMEFAMKLVDILFGRERLQVVNNGVMALL